MSRDLEREAQRWLTAEAAQDRGAADQALRRVFQELPQPPLPEGFQDSAFTDQVMARVAEDLRKDPFSRSRVRAAIAVAFLVAAGLLLVVGQVLRTVFSGLRPFDALDSLSRAADASAGWLPSTTQISQSLMADLAILSNLTARLLTTPPVILGVITLTLVCAGAFRLLRDLSKSKESPHADVG